MNSQKTAGESQQVEDSWTLSSAGPAVSMGLDLWWLGQVANIFRADSFCQMPNTLKKFSNSGSPAPIGNSLFAYQIGKQFQWWPQVERPIVP